jgi:hypothetical protein
MTNWIERYNPENNVCREFQPTPEHKQIEVMNSAKMLPLRFVEAENQIRMRGPQWFGKRRKMIAG